LGKCQDGILHKVLAEKLSKLCKMPNSGRPSRPRPREKGGRLLALFGCNIFRKFKFERIEKTKSLFTTTAIPNLSQVVACFPAINEAHLCGTAAVGTFDH
jgi:hypothetical protein